MLAFLPAALAAALSSRALANGVDAHGFDAQAVYEQASPAVVAIIAAAEDGVGELGSGSLVDARGTVLTNAHVLIDKATKKPFPRLHVYFKPARMTGDPQVDMRNPAEADILAYDSKLDLALIRVKSVPRAIRSLALGESERVAIGERVAAIGHPEQGGLWTLTTGVVGSLIADMGKVKGREAFQTEASMNRGNSGGPLLNAAGQIIGVNTAIARKAPDGMAITAVNFAVTSAVAKAWMKKTGEISLADIAAPAPKAPIEEKPAQPEKPAEPPVEPTPAPKTKLHQTITESQPFDPDKLVQEEMKEMENLEEEMHLETLKRANQTR